VAKKTYKQWVDFHLKKLKAEYPNRPLYVLQMMAGDMAADSVRKQGGAPIVTDTTDTTIRVGPNAGPLTPLIDKTKPTPTPKPTTPPGGQTYNDRVVSRIRALGGPYVPPLSNSTNTGNLALADLIPTFDNNDYIRLRSILNTLGYKGLARNKEEIDKLLAGMFENLFPVKNLDDLIAKLKTRVIPGEGDEAELPLRQIPSISRGELINFARSIVEDELMMARLDPEKENEIVDNWLAKAKKGSVTTPTRKVRNPKTGKLENVVETTKPFDKELEGIKLAERLKTMYPDQYKLAQDTRFANDVKSILSEGA